MEFCDKCGNLMIVERGHKINYLVCRKCGKKRKIKKEKVLLSERLAHKKREIVVMGKGEELAELPKTKIMCPKCENVEAYWWMQQTRQQTSLLRCSTDARSAVTAGEATAD